jgi:hypothetical protein
MTDSSDDVRAKVKRYFEQMEEASEGKTASFRRYKSSRFEETRGYLKSAVAYPTLSRGVTWLLRARVNGIWSATKAAKLHIIDETWEDHCPACGEAIEIDELEHVVLFCPEYGAQRRLLDLVKAAVLDAALDPKTKLTFLLGGNKRPGGAEGPLAPWTARQWAGLEGEDIGGDPPKAGFVPITDFLQEVMPRHMASLWALAQ